MFEKVIGYPYKAFRFGKNSKLAGSQGAVLYQKPKEFYVSQYVDLGFDFMNIQENHCVYINAADGKHTIFITKINDSQSIPSNKAKTILAVKPNKYDNKSIQALAKKKIFNKIAVIIFGNHHQISNILTK